MSDDLSGVLSGDAWEQAQYLPASAMATLPVGPDDPKKKKAAPAKPATTNLGRILTGDEWEQAQTMSGKAIQTHSLPLLPPVPKDVTQTPITSDRGKGEQVKGVLGAVLRQVVDPALENPFTTAATTAALVSPAGPVIGTAMAGQMAYHIAKYGWQKAHEMALSPEDRAKAEADPERVSGESAAVQAAMLGLAPFIHLGIKSVRGPSFGEGMLEAGAKGVHETLADPSVAPERTLPFQGELNDLHARSLASGADERIPTDATHPDGFETTATGARLTTKPRAVAGLVAPESVTPGKVKPLATEPASAPAEQHATEANALTASVKDYEAQRAAQDAAEIANADPIADLEKRLTESRTRSASAVEQASKIRRRPQGKVPYFESEQGAELLGAAAARHGLPEDASPYHPDSPLDAVWKQGHESAAQSYPDGFSMGGALTDNRIPGAVELPKTARGSDVPVPEGATPESVALANALKPSRYRTHTTDELAGAALDAQAELERAQAAVTASQTREHRLWEDPEKTPESIFYEDRGVHATDEPSAASEKALAQAKTRLAQIEREFAMRGVSGDGLAEVMQAAKEQRMERDGMQSDETLNAHMGADDPFGENAPSSSGLRPMAGTGETVTRGVSASIERRALANKLATSLGDLPGFQRMDFAEQAKGASELLAADPARALRIAKGEELPPPHLLPESVAVAVENKAVIDGDVATLRELATGKLASDATEMGRRIAAYRMRDPESPVSAIESVADARESGKDIPKMQTAEMKKMFGELKKRHPTVEQLSAILDSLRC